MEAGGVTRVCVSLERYFEDERARVLLTVTSGSVGDLARRLRTGFGLPGAFCLTSRGMLLPPEEPHTLFRDEDRIEVVPLREAWSPWIESAYDTETSRDRPHGDTQELETRKREALTMLALAEHGELAHREEGSGSDPAQGEGCLHHLEESAFLHQAGIPHRRKRVRKRPRKMPPELGLEHTPKDDTCVPPPPTDYIPELTSPLINVHIRFPVESSSVQQNIVAAGPGRVVHALTEPSTTSL